MRWAILKRDNFTCQYCLDPIDNASANIDHVIPWKFGGPTTPDNLVAACKSCNKAKGNKFLKKVGPRPAKASPFIARAKKKVHPPQEKIKHIPCEHRQSPYCAAFHCMVQRGELPPDVPKQEFNRISKILLKAGRKARLRKGKSRA